MVASCTTVRPASRAVPPWSSAGGGAMMWQKPPPADRPPGGARDAHPARLDGSPSADRARALVTSLAWPPGTVVRIVAALDVAPALWGGPWIPAVPPTRTSSRTRRWPTSPRPPGGCPAPRGGGPGRRAGAPPRQPSVAIVEDARIWHPDLIVVASRGHGPVETALLGSVSAAIVDHAALPRPPSLAATARPGSSSPRTARRRESRPVTSLPDGRPSPRSPSSWSESWTWPRRGGRGSPRPCSRRPWMSIPRCWPTLARPIASSSPRRRPTSGPPAAGRTASSARAIRRTSSGGPRPTLPATSSSSARGGRGDHPARHGQRGPLGPDHATCSVLVVKRPHDGH